MPNTAQSALPPWNTPNFLFKLWQYLLFRDYRAPSALPRPGLIASSSIATGLDLDVLTWDYEQPKGNRGVPADGFTLWVNAGDVVIPDPPSQGLKLSIDARQFCMMWPDGVARSYAIAAYRNTYQGEQATARVFDASWLNVT